MGRLLRALSVIVRDVLVNVIAASVIVPGPVRGAILRALGIDCRTSKISPRCFFGGRDISIGRQSFLNYGCFLDGFDAIHVGERCYFGPDVMLITSTHEIGTSSERGGTKQGAPIRIEDGCWLGGRVTVMPGVTVGAGCVV